MQQIQKLIQWIKHEEWIRHIYQIPLDGLPIWQQNLIQILRRLLSSWLRFRESRSAIQVGFLSYTTLISLVPVLAFVFSIVKTLGVHQQLKDDVISPVLNQWINSEQAPELRDAIEQMLQFVENTDFASLGAIGFLALGYAVIRLLGAVEQAMNDLWGIRNSRSFFRKITDYMSVAILIPIVLLVAGTTSHWIDSIHTVLGVWSSLGLKVLVLLFLWTGFGLLYYLLPNTRVFYGAAWRGGILGGSLWFLIHKSLISFQIGVADYNAIYAGFAAVPVLMLWIYGSWWAVIIGATLAAGYQVSEQHRHHFLRKDISLRSQELLALRVMVVLGHHYQSENTRVNLDKLEDALESEAVLLEEVIAKLEEKNLLVRSHQGDLVLARSITSITVWSIVQAMKGGKERMTLQGLYEDVLGMNASSEPDPVEELLLSVEKVWSEDAANVNLQVLCERLENPMISAEHAMGPNSEVAESSSNVG